jgi:hypothetical protein
LDFVHELEDVGFVLKKREKIRDILGLYKPNLP